MLLLTPYSLFTDLHDLEILDLLPLVLGIVDLRNLLKAIEVVLMILSNERTADNQAKRPVYKSLEKLLGTGSIPIVGSVIFDIPLHEWLNHHFFCVFTPGGRVESGLRALLCIFRE